MSNFGNLLTTGSSTPWSPFQTNINAFMRANLSGSSIHNNDRGNYDFNYVTGSQYTRNFPYGQAMGQTPQRWYIGTSKGGWIAAVDTDDDPHIKFDLDQGIGRTEALDSFIIQSVGGTAAWTAGGYHISGSNDDISWTPLTSSIRYPGGSGLSNNGYDETITFTNDVAYRYYKIRISDYTGTYAGFGGVIAWDSSLFKNQINLFNPNETNVTASFIESSNTSLQSFTSPVRDSYGWYFPERIGSVDINWDEPKLFRGWFGMGYSNGVYFPGIIQMYKSDTGELNSWELFSTINVFDSQYPILSWEQYFIDLQTPIKTQYLRLVVHAEGDDAPVNNFLMYAGWMYEMISASAPPAPTNLTTGVAGNNVLLKWSQNSGSDNRLVDLIYNVERSSDGGSNYTRIATISGSVMQDAFTASMGTPTQTNYVDTGVSDGSYIYRIQAQNQHHLTTGSFATSETLAVPPATKKIFVTNRGNIMINPNDGILIELD